MFNVKVPGQGSILSREQMLLWIQGEGQQRITSFHTHSSERVLLVLLNSSCQSKIFIVEGKLGMAPVTLEQISEALSTTQQAVINTEECLNRAFMVSTSTFFLGFSAGLFLQTKIRKYPKRLNFFLMPTVMGLAISTSFYKRLSKKCEQQWRQGSNYTYSTDTTDRDGIGASG